MGWGLWARGLFENFQAGMLRNNQRSELIANGVDLLKVRSLNFQNIIVERGLLSELSNWVSSGGDPRLNDDEIKDPARVDRFSFHHAHRSAMGLAYILLH